MLVPGDPVPTIVTRSLDNPRYAFDTAAGRLIAVSFVGAATAPGIDKFLAQLHAERGLFDDTKACSFVVTSNPGERQSKQVQNRLPGIRILLDPDHAMRRVFLRATGKPAPVPEGPLATWILDRGMRVLQVVPLRDPARHFGEIKAAMAQVVASPATSTSPAPVLQVPGVFEPEFCTQLVNYARAKGFEDSGFMRIDPATNQTELKVDYGHKRRSDCGIEDETLVDQVRARILRRLVPQIARAFQFTVTRMERHIICRYDAETGGHFRPHKDNTTLGTAHRRFAVSIGIGPTDYEGGDLVFPEFGPQTYRPALGGAVVFSCSLLHMVQPVTRGERFAYLPFLYDEDGAKLRLENARHIADPEIREHIYRTVSVEGG